METKNLEKLINAALRSQDSSANIVTRLRARQRETVFPIPGTGRSNFFSKAQKRPLEPTQPTIQWAQGLFFRGETPGA